jgi:hypothetical protein
MNKKLFRVKVVLFVMAENESDARSVATRARFDIFECIARKAEKVDPGWNDAIPYNADDDRTCLEILTNRQNSANPETCPIKLPLHGDEGIRIFEMDNEPIQPGQFT